MPAKKKPKRRIREGEFICLHGTLFGIAAKNRALRSGMGFAGEPCGCVLRTTAPGEWDLFALEKRLPQPVRRIGARKR